ncbi:uncharacterized protein LOC144439744 [Glandiceps talaboti]
MTENKLQLNDSKTEILLIRSKFNTLPDPVDHLKIGSASVPVVKTARNIGVTFDNTHMLTHHIKNTCNSIYNHLRRIGSIRKYITNKACQTLIHAILSAKLDYGNALLYGLPDNYIALLQRTQNTAARIVTRSKKFTHITPTLRDLHWLPVHFRIEFKILLLTYKAQNNKAPGYISELIEEYKPQRSLRSAKKSLLVQRTFNTKTYGGRAFTICAPKLWNDLPQDIRQSTSLEIFKKRLKHHMFMRAFCVN